MTKAPANRTGRDAKTGEYIPVKEAERRPSTRVIETIKPAPKTKETPTPSGTVPRTVARPSERSVSRSPCERTAERLLPGVRRDNVRTSETAVLAPRPKGGPLGAFLRYLRIPRYRSSETVRR
jgi:hypothetical protein